VETIDDLGLGLDVEVHQRVPADQQVKARDRGIAGDVVAAEDHPAAQVRAEGELGSGLLEVRIPQLGRKRLEGLRGVKADPGVTKGLVIDVCAIDLDPLRGFLDPQGLGERYRQRIRFLAAGAAGAPHPDLALPVDVREQFGHDLPLQEGPRLGIAEEPGHVDEDRVEQQAEFLRAALQPVPVIDVIRRPGLMHPLADPPCQGRPLVPGEVEAAGVADESQQILKSAVGLFGDALLGHYRFASTSPRITVAISSSGRMKSTAPAATTASGIPLNSASAGSSAMTVPPLDLTADAPIAPSLPVPVSTHAMALGPYAPATDSNSRSADGRRKCTSSLLDSTSTPFASTRR